MITFISLYLIIGVIIFIAFNNGEVKYIELSPTINEKKATIIYYVIYQQIKHQEFFIRLITIFIYPITIAIFIGIKTGLYVHEYYYRNKHTDEEILKTMIYEKEK